MGGMPETRWLLDSGNASIPFSSTNWHKRRFSQGEGADVSAPTSKGVGTLATRTLVVGSTSLALLLAAQRCRTSLRQATRRRWLSGRALPRADGPTNVDSPTPCPPGTSAGRARCRSARASGCKAPPRSPPGRRSFVLRTWHPQFLPQGRQPGFIASMGGAVGNSHQLADLLKRQAAPNSGDHHFAHFDREATPRRRPPRRRRSDRPANARTTGNGRPLPRSRAAAAAATSATPRWPCSAPRDRAMPPDRRASSPGRPVRSAPLAPRPPGSRTIGGRISSNAAA